MSASRVPFGLALLLCLIAGASWTLPAAARKCLPNEGGSRIAAPLDIYSRLPFQGENRKYLVHLPPSYDPAIKMPLVLVLHGGGGDIGFAVRMFQFNAKADKEGFIVAYPNGSGRFHDHILTWNAGACCGYAKAHHRDDVAFLRQFLDEVKNHYSVDPSRIYLVGFSNGAMMAYRLACEMPEQFAAFASVSGSMNGRERKPAIPIAGMIIHGTGDRHIPIEGGGGKLKKWGFDVHAKPLQYTVQFWRQADGCQSEVACAENGGQVQIHKYLHGNNDTEIDVYLIKGFRHSWPGGHKAWFRADPPYPYLSATDLCWEFFSKHARDLSGAQICHEPGQVANGHLAQP